MSSLLDYMNVHALRALAGAAFGRGDAYWRDGNVLSVESDGDTVRGAVRGTVTYFPRLSTSAGYLEADCTCPVGGAICKHVVALALAYLADRRPAPAPEAASTAFPDRRALEAWAAEHDVRHALWLSASSLYEQLPAEPARRYGLGYVLGRLALRDVGSLEGARRHVGVHALEAPIAEAARRVLEAAAASVRAGLEEEQRLPDTVEDRVTAPLWSMLRARRAELRLAAPPRSYKDRPGTWKLDTAAGAIDWVEPGRIARPHEPGLVEIAVHITFPAGGVPVVTCTCRAEDGCTHGVAAIDATLERLLDPRRYDEHKVMAEELLQPGWARLFRELDVLAAPKPAPLIEVWWEIEYQLGCWTISPLVKRQLKNGTMSTGTRPTAARLLDEHAASMTDTDRRISELIMDWLPSRSRRPSYPVRAFGLLVGHPRVLAEWADRPVDVRRSALGFRAEPDGGQIQLVPWADGTALTGERLDDLLRMRDGDEPLVIEDHAERRLTIVDVGDEALRLWRALGRHGTAFPPEAHAPLLERLAKLERKVPVQLPKELKGREIAGELTTVVRLRVMDDVTLELELLVRPGAGAPLYAPGSGPRDVLLAKGGERVYTRRTLTDEPAIARAALAGLPMAGAEEGPPYCFRFAGRAGRGAPSSGSAAEGQRGGIDDALALIAALQEPRPGLEVEWLDDRRVHVTRAATPEQLRVQVERKRDWFGIVGELKVETGRLELAVLLDAARRQQRYVRVDADRWVELSDTLRNRLQAVADQTYSGRNALELSPAAAPALQALDAAGAKVVAAPDWRALTERLLASQQLAPKPPAALTATLRDYQVEGHAWLSRVAAWGGGAVLADDMGLGKTIQAIALLLDRAKLGPALVLAPTSVAFNWAEELRRFAPSLRPVMYGDEPDRAGCIAKLKKKDVVIASYGLLVRDGDVLASRAFATLVLDEAQALKNAGTRRAQAARKLDAGFRVALSGTPLENHLGELWSLYAIVFPGLLGSWEQFRERYAGPIERMKDADARAALARVLRPFLLRRTKQEVAKELPSRTEIEVPIALSKPEWEMYEDARLAAVAELDKQGKDVRDEQRRFQILAALTRLRLLASHPRLYDGKSELASSKLARLLALLEELRAEGHKALVFSQFTSHLALVREAVEAAGHRWLYLDGSTAPRERKQRIEQFQAGEADVFLISLKAGGTGINLTAADYVIHLDPWWNPAVEDQATDRAHRIGQTRPVTVYRLVARGTIEQQILRMHVDKRALVAGVLDGSDAAARLTNTDLLALLAASDGHSADADDAS